MGKDSLNSFRIKKDTKVYKMRLKNHLYALFPLFFYTILFIVSIFLFYDKLGFPNRKMVALFVFFYTLLAVPALIIHIEYLVNDWRSQLIIDSEKRIIYYSKGNKSITFHFSEIKQIFFFGETKGFNNLSTDNYFFYFFSIINQEPIIITCLTIKDINKTVPDSKITRIRRLFPSIMFESFLEK